MGPDQENKNQQNGNLTVKILLCCEFFYPSVGGAQEVVRQLATRLARWGHDVSVATSFLANRTSDVHEGVKIISFNISGNWANGLMGEVQSYRQFMLEGRFDLVFIYAAQQWTLDAILDELPRIKARKVLVPCGYSGLPDPGYARYFARLPAVLSCFDALVYHAYDYRDHHFAKEHQLNNSFFIPNAADDIEFSSSSGADARSALELAPDEVVLLTVGSLNGAKGHLEVAEAFSKAVLLRSATLILNGNDMPPTGDNMMSNVRKLVTQMKSRGILHTARFVLGRLLHAVGLRPDYFDRLERVMKEVNGRPAAGKRIIRTNLARRELIETFLASDLFVFASIIEYSPLVLFEACAAGLPFLTVPVGNSREIVEWTQGGELCPAKVDAHGFTRVDTTELARRISDLAADPERLAALAANGRKAWRERYNWETISREYEALFARLTRPHSSTDSTHEK
ncbi:glycosyltransferase family 4 protein [Herbaspirillum sp. AP02]|uniref:glycosyltransferase family 4 protein n=1 Tax=unclassified Herbaspirillum TaxID=2624150 RepID=UPI0018CAFF33|nr:glycosyltransferase family 4 protein [Herbaspirillum sp. AP02]MBG7620186.1 glycosyltransferase family 4 protein [Herbaspirillum sp. AP02]